MKALLDDEPHDAALNMAIDETLLRTATQPTLRIYRWARPALSFGYFGKWSEAAEIAPGRDIVRRWTGGGIVLHGEDFTFSLIVPRSHSFFRASPGESYRAIHQCVAQAIGNASLAIATAAGISPSCFENPVQHDVLIANRKVAGGAQRRAKCGLLHQGSIQTSDEAACLSAALIRVFSARSIAVPLTVGTQSNAAKLAQEKYATGEWTRRVL